MKDCSNKAFFGSAAARCALGAAAGVLLAGPALAEAYVPGAGGIEVRLYQTTAKKGFRELPTAEFTIHPYPAAPAIDVDTAKELHEFVGLGASLTDASAWILAHMEPAKRERLLRDLFTPEGCNLAALRLNIGASDYSTALYSYDDTPGDAEMRDFSLKRDEAHLIPMAREIQRLRPDILWFAAPWSPPGWMKTSGLMVGGTLKDECRGALANYFVRYVQGYAAHGIRVSAVSPQNEPLCDTGGQYPCCTYTEQMESRFVAENLAPALRAAGLDTKIWIYDHNPDRKGGAIARIKRQLADPKVRAAIGGVAWHCYGEPETATNMLEVAALHPDVPFYHTENGPHVVVGRSEWWWAAKVFNMIQCGCRLFTSWNLCLDELGMPASGSHLCGGFTVVDSETQEVTYSPQYNLFRHIGPFVKRGARVLEATGSRGGTRLILFRNPDGEHVLVVVCDGSLNGIQRRRIAVKYKGLCKTLPLPGRQWSVSTLVFR